MLIISKMFTILCLLCLYGNREYPGSFRKKAVSSKLLFQMSAQVKWEERKPFWSGQAQIYPLNYFLHMEVMCWTIIKVFIILFLLYPWEQGTPWQFSKQNTKLSFQLSFPRYILLPKRKGKERPFLEVCNKGSTLWDYPQKHLVDIRDEKVYPFVKFEIILPLLCFLLDPFTNKVSKKWSSKINLWIDSRTYEKYRILVSAGKGLIIIT